MKTHEIAQQLGVTTQTLGNWIKNFDTYFSDGAKALKTRQRTYEENDLIVLATIAKLSHEGLNYETINERLKSGERVESVGAVQFGLDGAMIARSTAESWVDSSALRSEVEALTRERDKLADMLADRDLKIESLNERIADLERKLGRAEGRLEEKDKPRRWFWQSGE